MKTLTFVSHYNKTELNIAITTENANLMFGNKTYSPMELYLADCDRVHEGHDPIYFSTSQIKKLNAYLTGTDVWESVSITKNGNMTTAEILSNLRDNGGFNNFHHWNKAEVAEYILANYPCSKSVANKVAEYIA